MADVFTVSQIAFALRKKRQWIARCLEGISASSHLIVRGAPASAYALDVLPKSLREQLETEAFRRGYRNAAHLLCVPDKPWEPAIPLAEIHPDCIAKAAKLQKALLPSLYQRQNDLTLTAAEFEKLGVDDYAREFGHSISTRTFRSLFSRVVERAGAAADYTRLEIYLDPSPRRRTTLQPTFSPSLEGAFELVNASILGWDDRNNPTSLQKATTWLRAFEAVEYHALIGRDEKAVRREAIQFLARHAIPMIAANEDALRVAWNWKYTRWIESGRNIKSLHDGREGKKGEKRKAPLDQQSKNLIVGHALFNCGGRVSQAVRELVEAEALDPRVMLYFRNRRSTKSDVPTSLRQEVTPEIRMLEPFHLSRRAVQDATPPLDLSYDGIYSMTCLQADDFTMPVKFIPKHSIDGRSLTRGQILLCIDFRTLCILGFCLYPEGFYHAGLIRTLFTRVFAEYGLPEMLYLERGIWENSKLVTGGPRARKSKDDGLPFSEEEVEAGLGQYGVKFLHSLHPRSKPVERVGGLLQDMMEGEPGYCGRDERRDLREEVKHQEEAVRSGKAEASRHFYTEDEWEERFKQLCIRFNETPQEGKRLNGMSPIEAFERLQNTSNPPTFFSPACRYLLAEQIIENVEIKQRGVRFKYGKEKYRYYGEEMADKIGQRFTAFFNPECPELCTFASRGLRNPFTVQRAEEVNALFPDDHFEIEIARAKEHMKYAKARYTVLKTQFKKVVRHSVIDAPTAKLGAHIEQKRTEFQEEAAHRVKVTRETRKRARKLGLPEGFASDGDATVAEGMRMMEESNMATQAGEEENQ